MFANCNFKHSHDVEFGVHVQLIQAQPMDLFWLIIMGRYKLKNVCNNLRNSTNNFFNFIFYLKNKAYVLLLTRCIHEQNL